MLKGWMLYHGWMNHTHSVQSTLLFRDLCDHSRCLWCGWGSEPLFLAPRLRLTTRSGAEIPRSDPNLCLLCNLDKRFSFFVPLFSLPNPCVQEVWTFGSKICLSLCGALHCGALVLLGTGGTLTPRDLLDSCPPSPAAVTGWSILQQPHCSCSGTSSSISSQTCPTHGKDSFHRLSPPFWILPTVHCTQTGKQLRSDKQEYLLVKRPWTVVLLGVCALSMMTSLKLGWEIGRSGKGQLKLFWRFLGIHCKTQIAFWDIYFVWSD